MKIILCGFGRAGKECLLYFLNKNIPQENILIYTYPEESNKEFLEFLKEKGIKHSVQCVNDDLETVRAFSPDYLISAYYRDIISNDVLQAVDFKAMNMHPSLLPDYKGSFSSVWAILNGEEETGITFHYVIDRVDSGNIILQKRLTIQEEDTAYSLYQKLIDLFMKYFDEAFQKLCAKDPGIKQPRGGKGRFYNREVPYGGRLDSDRVSYTQAKQFIRAMHFPPFEGARFVVNGEEQEVSTFSELSRYRKKVRGKDPAIFVSSSCLKEKDVKHCIKTLSECGFKSIELSGGAEYCENIEEELGSLRSTYNLEFLCHNYFPAPKEPFVLNLASVDDDIYEKTFNHLVKAIQLSKHLGLNKYSFHAGFFLDIPINQIGENISHVKLNDRNHSIRRFCEGYRKLKEQAEGIELYLENNIVSQKNLETFQGQNPFMLTSFQEYKELKEHIDFKLLLDVGHLKVTCHSFGLNFKNELAQSMSVTDYIHVSDNDGLADQNKCVSLDSDLFQMLKELDLSQKTITLEVYEGLDRINESYNLLKELSHDTKVAMS